ncbi:MAG TPA: glycosyltransferase family 4 protein [bacterium]|nr:glycosyltransferase family 4 protein [bacterium]
MKIAFIGQKGIPAQTGGVEKQVEELLIHLAARGHDIYAYARRGYAQEISEYKGVKIIPLPFIKGKNFEAISNTFLAVLHSAFRRFDIIHFQSIGPASLLWLAKLLNPRTPIVFTFHCQDYYHKKWGLFARWYLRLGEKIGCRLADQTLVTSQELTIYALARYDKGAVYVPSGINPPTLPEVREIRRWGLEKDNYIFIASRLIRHKGIHYVIKAFKNLKTDKKLVIAGEGAYTDDYVKELKELAGDDKRIIFVGNQGGALLSELYANAYMFIQSSEYEGLSMGLLEAMSYGLPCLASDIPANLEAMNGLGLSFRNKDVSDLSHKLQYALDNQEIVKAQGQALRERTRQEYNWEKIVDQTIAIYNRLLAKK